MMLTEIKKARLIKGLQQQEVAELLGVSKVSVSKWENGKMLPKAKRLQEVADVYGVPVEVLINGREVE